MYNKCVSQNRINNNKILDYRVIKAYIKKKPLIYKRMREQVNKQGINHTIRKNV